MKLNKKLNCIISRESIIDKINTLAKSIHSDFQGKDIVLVCVLNGAFMFFNDLLRELTKLKRDNIYTDFIKVSSYGLDNKSKGEVNLVQDISVEIKDKNVIIVEDIIDTGITMEFLLTHVISKSPRSLKVAKLLYKKRSNKENLVIDYKCFKIDDYFVVGYGLDWKHKYRNLEEIYKFSIGLDEK